MSDCKTWCNRGGLTCALLPLVYQGGFTAEILMGSGSGSISVGASCLAISLTSTSEIQMGDIILSEIFALYGMYETQRIKRWLL